MNCPDDSAGRLPKMPMSPGVWTARLTGKAYRVGPLSVAALTTGLERYRSIEISCFRITMVIGELLFVAFDLPIELIDELVDGRVHVLFGGISVNVVSGHMEPRLGLLSELFDTETDLNTGYVIDVSCDPLELHGDVFPQSGSDLDVMTAQVYLHLTFLDPCGWVIDPGGETMEHTGAHRARQDPWG